MGMHDGFRKSLDHAENTPPFQPCGCLSYLRGHIRYLVVDGFKDTWCIVL